uniref:G2/M phase-specific E3 ubiquitin-protein ligase n=1 Tax=Calidris pygmaea TaxID=425635 RepID=A0A8C3PRG4_9CHAR
GKTAKTRTERKIAKRTLPPAPQRCSFLPPFALSPPACVLCRWVEADPDTCGHKLERDGICAHEFCLVSSSGLCQQPVEELGLKGFLPEDINRTVNRATQKHCFVCGESGATITCREMSCDRSFHLPCAVDGACVTQFFFQYRSFCWEHGPRQTVEMSPEEDTTCLICLDRVGEGRSYGTMVCPVCRHAWFHRHCIQGQAVRDGITCFRCPLCRDRDVFLSEMLTMGIRVPFRLVSCLAHKTGGCRCCAVPRGAQQSWSSTALRSSSCNEEGKGVQKARKRTWWQHFVILFVTGKM